MNSFFLSFTILFSSIFALAIAADDDPKDELILVQAVFIIYWSINIIVILFPALATWGPNTDWNIQK
jgi:hypothetical protein